jgi:hypothetical protein
MYIIIFSMLTFCLAKSRVPHTKGARGDAVVEALRYNPKVAGSIPDGVIRIFH